MGRNITLSMAVLMTPVVIVFFGTEAKAQQGPGPQTSLPDVTQAAQQGTYNPNSGGPNAAQLGQRTAKVAPAQSAEISGAWKIETRGGPVPLCNFVQLGNDLKGSCVGPIAAGTATGIVDGQTVRWRWQWVTYTGNAAAGFDFLGTLGADNTITGVVERREIGMSLNFTAKRQEAPTAPAAPAPPGYRLERRISNSDNVCRAAPPGYNPGLTTGLQFVTPYAPGLMHPLRRKRQADRLSMELAHFKMRKIIMLAVLQLRSLRLGGKLFRHGRFIRCEN